MRAKVHFTTDEVLIPRLKKIVELQLLPDTAEEAKVIERLYNLIKQNNGAAFHLHADGRLQSSVTLSVSAH